MRVYWSENHVEWSTPLQLFRELDYEFHFDIDLAASADNAKCARYYTKEDDALSQEWTGVCWLNPPYGRDLKSWIRKAYESALNGATVICLVPARTDTGWFHDYALKGEIRFLRGRLGFSSTRRGRAPFPSCVVVFRPPVVDGGAHA